MNRRNLLKAGIAISASPWSLLREASGQMSRTSMSAPGSDGWVSLLNGHSLDGWYTMLEKSGKGVAEQKKMVVIEQGMLHIMGNEIGQDIAEPGYISTLQEYENVHIRVEYKWGVKRFSPRSMAKRDNGILYGLVGPDKVWPRCAECQIEENDVGDAYLVDGIRGIQSEHGNGIFGQGLEPSGWSQSYLDAQKKRNTPVREPVGGRMIKDGDFENLNDWNLVEVIWQGDRAAHIVNGRTVNVITSLQQPNPQNPGEYIPLSKGKIAIEIEFAEIWFRRIEVKSLV